MKIFYWRTTYGLYVIMREETKSRLATTCFRQKPDETVRRAGNFVAWENMAQLMEENSVVAPFLRAVDAKIEDGRISGGQSISLTYSDVAGWASTVPKAVVEGYKLEERKLNASPKRTATGLFVVDTNFRAPLTHWLTIKYELRQERKEWTLIIHSLYPAKDVGKLFGDVSEREDRVFLDFSQPGSDTWVCDD